MQGEGGLTFLLDLGEATALRHGDGLVLEDGRIVEMRAKPEPLLQVRGRDAHHLTRLAWHLGNRHVPAAIERSRLLIRADHVIAAINWVAFIAPGAPANRLRSHSSGITARRNWWQRGHHTCISNP